MKPTPPGAPGPGDCSRLGAELGRHGRTLHLLKSQMASWIPAGLDQAALGVLLTLVRGGPRRQGELAELTFLDPSTISRHVAQLARAGFVERRPDPVDGRAVQLAATASGAAAGDQIIRRRDALVTDLLSGWDRADIDLLVTLLSRLNDDLEVCRPTTRPIVVVPDDHQPHLDRADPVASLHNLER